VSLDDAVAAITGLLETERFRGPVNVVAPQAVAQRDFARALGRVLRRPAILPIPASVLRLLLGAMADEALLASTRAAPARLAEVGFVFRDPELEPALRRLLAG
jgi:uncharacterized protein